VPSGTLLAGENLLAVDLVATRLMGFDPMAVKTFQALLASSEFDHGIRGLDEIVIATNVPSWAHCLSDRESRFLSFRPHPGWIGHIEIQQQQVCDSR
jgi:hypothetical protein